jgi:hypothetical protein
MGRLADAYRILVGRSDLSELKIRESAKLVRIEAEWLSICRSLEHTLQDLNLADDKLRKREERAEKRAKAATPATPVQQFPSAPLSQKDAMRARLRAEGKLGVPPGRARGGNGSTDEPGGKNAT